MQKALTNVDRRGVPSPRQAPAGEPNSVISCSAPGLDDAVPKAPEVRCLQVLQAVTPGHPVRPSQFAFEVQGVGGFRKFGLKAAPQKPQKTSWLFISVATLCAAAEVPLES